MIFAGFPPSVCIRELLNCLDMRNARVVILLLQRFYTFVSDKRTLFIIVGGAMIFSIVTLLL